MRFDELDCRLVGFPLLRITVFFFNFRGKLFQRTIETTTSNVDNLLGFGHICYFLSGTNRAKG